MNRLTVTCDDCGLSEGVNAAALDLYRRGMAHSASVLVNFPAAGHALELFRGAPGLALGVHLNLTEGRPLTAIPASAGLTLPDGRFRPLAALALRSLRPSVLMLSCIEEELAAQFAGLARMDVAIQHVTTHLQFHVLPSLRRIVLRLAERYRVPWVRTHRLRATVVPWNPLLSRTLGSNPSPARPFAAPWNPWLSRTLGRDSSPAGRNAAPRNPPGSRAHAADPPSGYLDATPWNRPGPPAARAGDASPADLPAEPDYMAVLRNWQGREPAALAAALAGLSGSVELVVHPGIAADPGFPPHIAYGARGRYAETQFLARLWPLLRPPGSAS